MLGTITTIKLKLIARTFSWPASPEGIFKMKNNIFMKEEKFAIVNRQDSSLKVRIYADERPTF